MIRNIIFDLGNVLIPLEINKTRLCMAIHGLIKPSKSLRYSLTQYEKGLIDSSQFLQVVSNETLWGSSERFKKIWNQLLTRFEVEKLKLLEELQKEYKLFILSNINSLHEHRAKEVMGKEIYQSFCACFVKIYYSHHIGYRKPENESWQLILDENKLVPAETLFVDDLKINADAAQELGLKTWHVKGHKEVYKIQEVLNKLKD